MGQRQGPGRHHLNPQTTPEAFEAYEAVRHRLPPVRRRGACAAAADLDAIADRFDVLLLDAFGVLNIGETAIAGVPDRIARLQAAGKRVLVVTNAAGYPHSSLMAKYARLGYDFAPEDVISSRLTLLDALTSMPATDFGLMATQSLGHADLDHLDFTYLAEDPAPYEAASAFLLLGSAAWSETRQTLLQDALRRDPRPVLVGNPDIVAPREAGFSVEPGNYAHRLADATGVSPAFFGKPFHNIYDLALARLGAGYARDRILMVGDSLHTDILGGQSAGVQTALIAGYGFFAAHNTAPFITASGIEPDFILERP